MKFMKKQFETISFENLNYQTDKKIIITFDDTENIFITHYNT